MGNTGENPVFICMLTSAKLAAKGSKYSPKKQNTLKKKLRMLMVLSVLANKRKMKQLVILKRAIIQHQNFLAELYCGEPKQGG